MRLVSLGVAFLASGVAVSTQIIQSNGLDNLYVKPSVVTVTKTFEVTGFCAQVPTAGAEALVSKHPVVSQDSAFFGHSKATPSISTTTTMTETHTFFHTVTLSKPVVTFTNTKTLEEVGTSDTESLTETTITVTNTDFVTVVPSSEVSSTGSAAITTDVSSNHILSTSNVVTLSTLTVYPLPALFLTRMPPYSTSLVTSQTTLSKVSAQVPPYQNSTRPWNSSSKCTLGSQGASISFGEVTATPNATVAINTTSVQSLGTASTIKFTGSGTIPIGSMTIYPQSPSLLTPTSNFSRTLGKRQVGATVYAVINGHTVHWVNTYSPTADVFFQPGSSSVSTEPTVAPDETSHVPLPTDTFPTSSISLPGATTSVNVSTLPNTSATGTATSIILPPVATNTSCAVNSGRFVIDFDDLQPNLNDEADEFYPLLPNPYHLFYWTTRFSYVPTPYVKYEPDSAPRLGMFIIEDNANIHSGPEDLPAGILPNGGSFGAGPRAEASALNFHAYTAHVGCKFDGPCDLLVSGLRYDNKASKETVRARETFTIPACIDESGCSLNTISFDPHFKNLTSLHIVAFKSGSNENVSWFIDDIHLRWSDNSCEAAAERVEFGKQVEG